MTVACKQRYKSSRAALDRLEFAVWPSQLLGLETEVSIYTDTEILRKKQLEASRSRSLPYMQA
jgi:hypothetical protein